MDFNYLRRNSLFAPAAPSTGINPNALSITPDMMQTGEQQIPPQAQPLVNQPQNNTLTDAYKEMMDAPSGPANQRYKDFLSSEAPQRDSFKPTKMNRLAAILAGGSTGIQQGGAAGYKAATDILDEPYNEAMGDYKLRASKLEAGAGLEDKEVGNKVKTYRDFVTDQQNKRKDDIALQTLGETKRVNDGRLANWQSESSSRETPSQKMDRALGTANAQAKGRVSSATEIYNNERQPRLADAIKIAGVRSDNSLRNQNAKFDSIKDLKQYVADNITKDKYTYKTNKNGMVVAVNNSDPTDVIVTSIDSGKLSDKEKADLGLKNAKDLKAAPGAGKKTETTTVVDGNKKIVTSEVTSESGNKEQVKPIPGNDKLEAFSADSGKTWKARAKK